MTRPSLPHAILVAAAVHACAGPGVFIWVDDLPAPLSAQEGTTILAAGDTIQVRVFGQEALATRARIRPDGRFTMPLLDEVEAAGFTPSVLGQQIETRLKDFIKLPVVTVSVEELKPLVVFVAGEVARQGPVTLEPGAGVLQAVLLAGGLNDFAHKDQIFVLRGNPVQRIRFDWRVLLRGEGRSTQFRLRPGDTLVVE